MSSRLESIKQTSVVQTDSRLCNCKFFFATSAVIVGLAGIIFGSCFFPLGGLEFYLTVGIGSVITVGGAGGFIYQIFKNCCGSSTNDVDKETDYIEGPKAKNDPEQKISKGKKSNGVQASKGVKKARPYLKGTVYVKNTTTGPIAKDRTFDFAKNLRNEDGSLFTLKEDDVYVVLDGVFDDEYSNKKSVLYLDSDGYAGTSIHLPASLFNGVEEGGRIRFYYHNKLIELTCRQRAYTRASEGDRFESTVKRVQQLGAQSSVALFAKDIDAAVVRGTIVGDNFFRGTIVGDDLCQLDSQGREKNGIKDLSDFAEDQKKHGEYGDLHAVSQGENHIIYNLHLHHGVALDSIQIIRSVLRNGMYQYWILIPHEPTQSQFPAHSQPITQVINGTTTTYTKDTFDPKKSHRLLEYHHGKCSVFVRTKKENVQLSYNEQGFLQLLFSKAEIGS